MTPVDRKRLRELALAAQKMIEEQPTVGGWVQRLWNEYVKAANPQTILELLDALEAQDRPTTDDARDAARYRHLDLMAPSEVEITQTSGGDRRWKVTFWLSPPEEFFDQHSDGGESLGNAIDAAIAEQAKGAGMSDLSACLYGDPDDVAEILEAPVTRTGEQMRHLESAALVNVLRRLGQLERAAKESK